MPDFNSAHTAADFEAAVPAALAAVQAVDLNTLAKLNTIVADATLIDTADSRLSDARTPTAHAASHATGGGDAITPAAIGAATAAQGNTADTAVQPARAINSGIGMEGGGDLSADRTLALTAAVLASLALADTATQPGDDADTLGSGAATDGQVLTADGAGNAAWEASAGGGGSAAGSDGQIQFALSGGFSADAGLAYNSTTKALTVGGATVTTDSPVLNLAQTWNEGATVFTGLKLNVTSTASAATSLLMDLQVGAVSQFSVAKTGAIRTPYFGADGTYIRNFGSNVGLAILNTSNQFKGSVRSDRWTMSSDLYISWSDNNISVNNADTRLYRDAAYVIGQRNATNPQEHRWWNTWTDAANGEYGYASWIESANVFKIGTAALGTGTKRNLVLDGANRAVYSETPADIAAALVAHGIMAPA